MMIVRKQQEVNLSPVDMVQAIETTHAIKMIRIAQDTGCPEAHNRISKILGIDGVGGRDLKLARLWRIAQERGWCIWDNGRFILTERGMSI